jgi:hypothetical protein
MATSRSHNETGWRAGAFVFSGRPDPTWPVTDETAVHLERIWASLDALEGEAPKPPSLGYRGCFVQDQTGRLWTAFGGAVILTESGSSSSRRDEAQAFERSLLASAPPGSVPPKLVP